MDAGPVAFDDASAVTVSGADPSRPVTVQASAPDADGTTWTSHATFTPGSDGSVDLETAAPLSGSYTGAHATGLIWSLSAGGDRVTFFPRGGSMTVTFTASQAGRTSATVTQTRSLDTNGVRTTSVGLSSGFVAHVFTPANPPAQAGAVLVLGGSEGGLSVSALEAQALAARGHPALALAYFDVPGLPQELANIPLEYFARALSWLNRQPGVDPHRTAVVGGSRGSEAALLVGADYPDLVHAVVATSPTSFLHGGFPDPSEPAWTWHGKPLPSDTSDLRAVTPVDPATIIPVTRIRGPVLLLCGTDDALWPSCKASDVVKKELTGRPVTELREPGAGHYVDLFVPNLPVASNQGLEDVGGTAQADALGRLKAWPDVLTFLDHIPR